MRKLAAIMFTDIESFTKLMRQNEAEAIRLLERHNQIYIHYIKQFKGQTIKFMGDGTLTIFSSAIDAVKCAVALQRAMQKERSIPVRIGIHQGDVIIENKDVLGDAVNLASRIQPCGIGGSILISEKVHDELQNHNEISDVALGSFDLKNISHPVNLFAIKAPGIKVPDNIGLPQKQNTEISIPLKKTGKTSYHIFNNPRALQIVLVILIIGLLPVWFITKTRGNENSELLKTIAVVPFENIDKDEQNNILADGLTEEMISLLSSNIELKIKKIPGTAINSHNSNLQKLLREVKAGCVLEGKVQHDDDSLFVFVNLRNISNNQIIWSHIYREKFRDLMEVQEQVAFKIADALNTDFTKADIKNFVLERTDNSDAYALYIKGRYALGKRTQQSMQEAITLFNKALQEDSNFALAYSGVGDTYTILVDNGYISYDSGANLARAAVNHAFKLDSSSAEIRASRAIFFSALEGRHMDALNELKLSLSLSPNYADAHQWYALELAADGQFDSALLHIDKATELEPFSERIWLNKGLILEFSRRYKDALNVLNYSIARFSDNSQLFYNYKTECHYWLGQKDSVLYYAKFNNGAVNDYKFWEAVCNHNEIQLEKLLKANSAAGPLDNETLATYYVFMRENKKALDCIQQAYNKKEFNWLIYLNVAPKWNALHKEAVFHNIVLHMQLK